MRNKSLENTIKDYQAKIAFYERKLLISSCAEKQFELEELIKECEAKIKRLKNKESMQGLLEDKSQIELCSERGIDYTKLDSLLAVGKWQEADLETTRVMFIATSREEEKSLRVEDIENFPSEDLHTINKLWLHYSRKKFGFSVQKKIYQSLGGNKKV
jgi:hypothetical protein